MKLYRIKPLEWDYDVNGNPIAWTHWGRYSIWTTVEEKISYAIAGVWGIFYTNSKDHAKSLCEADYIRRMEAGLEVVEK